MNGFADALDRYFRITERGSTIGTELRGGIITFLSMSYILVVNPLILYMDSGEATMGQLFTATALAAAISSLLMGLYARLPVALAPGMGLNMFLSMTVCYTMGFSFNQGLLVVLVSGMAFFVISVTGLRRAILDTIPKALKVSIAAGIGFFIALVGMYNAGIIVHGEGSALALGDMTDPGVLLALLCITITLVLWHRNKWYAVSLGIAVTWVIGLVISHFGVSSDLSPLPSFEGVSLTSTPDFALFGTVFGGLEGFDMSMAVSFFIAVLSLCIVDLFDTTGTLIGVGASSGLLDEDGNIESLDKAFAVDSLSSVTGAVCGTSSTTAFIESLTGIQSGARTGLMAIVVGLFFILSLAFLGLITSVTSCCTTGALVLVGIIMLSNLGKVDWNDHIGSFTAIVTIIMMGLTGSITDGIGFGFIVYAFGSAVSGKAHDVSVTMWVVVALFMAYFALINLVN